MKRTTAMTRALAAAVIAVLAGPVHADPATAAPHVARATELHKEGKYAEALDELKLAYALDAQPNLLYAIAQVHVKLGRCPDAIAFYERFLATNPDAGPASAARQAIDICKSTPPPTEVTPPPAPTPTPTPAPPAPTPVVEPAPQPAGATPIYKDPIGGALVGAGLVSGIVAVVLYRGARADLDDAEGATTYQASEDLVAGARSKRTYAAIAGGAAFALIGGGVIHMVLRDRGSSERAVAITPSIGGALVTWSGRF